MPRRSSPAKPPVDLTPEAPFIVNSGEPVPCAAAGNDFPVSSAAACARDTPRPPDLKPTLEIRSRTDQTQAVRFRSDGSDPDIPVRLVFL